MKKDVEKDVILKEINKQLNWKEIIITKIYLKTSIKIYKAGIMKGFNSR